MVEPILINSQTSSPTSSAGKADQGVGKERGRHLVPASNSIGTYREDVKDFLIIISWL